MALADFVVSSQIIFRHLSIRTRRTEAETSSIKESKYLQLLESLDIAQVRRRAVSMKTSIRRVQIL